MMIQMSPAAQPVRGDDDEVAVFHPDGAHDFVSRVSLTQQRKHLNPEVFVFDDFSQLLPGAFCDRLLVIGAVPGNRTQIRIEVASGFDWRRDVQHAQLRRSEPPTRPPCRVLDTRSR